LQRLAEFGRELRRPTADYLRDGAYEVRIKHLGVNYRILYGFVGQDIVLVSHGISKLQRIPAKEIDVAIERLAKYRTNPKKYTSTDLVDDEEDKTYEQERRVGAA
jgi:phage-related protein